MNNTRRRRHDPKQLETESSFYDVYNNLAEAYDAEMIKDWTESLNFLLVFAAIFSAVLTAFIIESIKRLEEDPQDTTVDILITLTNQLANGSFTGYTKPTFEAPTYAVIVNSLFFASISSSLFAALAAVIALQWVSQFDARLDTADPEKLALVREARLMGVNRWKMNEIIGGLPILLYISVFLFFAGMVEWMLNIHRVVGSIVLAGAACALGFYIITAIIAVIYPGSPYRSKLSQWIATSLRWLVAITLKGIYIAIDENESLGSIYEGILRRFPNTTQWENTVIRRVNVKVSAVMWAIKNVNRSPQFYRRLLHITKYASQLDIKNNRDAAELRNIPWKDVFYPIRAYISNTPVDAMSPIVQDTRVFLECIAEHTRFGLEGIVAEAPFYDPTFTDAENEANTMIYLWNRSRSKETFTKWWQDFFSGARGVSHSRRVTAFAVKELACFIHSEGRTMLSITYLNLLSSAVRIQLTSPPESILSNRTLRVVLKAIYSVAFNDSADICWSESIPLRRPSDDVLLAVESCHNAVLSQYLAQLWHVKDEAKGEGILWRIHRILFYHSVLMKLEADPFLWNFDPIEGLVMDVRYSPLYNEQTGKLKNPSLTRVLICLVCSKWLRRYGTNPLLHDVMRVFLSFQLRFPFQSPLLGAEVTSQQLGLLSQYYAQYLDGLRPGSLGRNLPRLHIPSKWYSGVIHVILGCDKLISSGCTQEQRLVIVKLIASNTLRHHTVYSPYRRSYHPFSTVKDSSLSLISARAHRTAFTGGMPSQEEIMEIGSGWVVALKYWCDTFKMLNSDREEEFLRYGLLSQNESVQTTIVTASSTNEALRLEVQKILDGTTKNDELLRLYVACRKAPWFSSYMEEKNRWKSVLDICDHSPLSAQFVPLLSSISPFVTDEASWRKLANALVDSLKGNPEELPKSLVFRLLLAIQSVMDSYPDPLGVHPAMESQLGESLEELVMEGMVTILMGQEDGEAIVEVEN